MNPFEDMLLTAPTAFAASPNSEWPKAQKMLPGFGTKKSQSSDPIKTLLKHIQLVALVK